MPALTPALRDKYAADFASMTINPGNLHEAQQAVAVIIAHRAIYEEISRETNGVPWDLIAALHYREASLAFDKFLGDGEPLSRATVNVPAHMGPFFGPDAFQKGAVAALVHEGFQKITDWSIGSKLFHAEMYNGPGYFNHNLASPYVWGGTNKYTHGWYLSDGQFSLNAHDPRIGVAAIVATLLKSIPDLLTPNQGVALMATAPLTPTTPSAPAPSPASVATDLATLAKTSFSTIWTGIAGLFGSATAGTIVTILASQLPAGTMAIILAALGIAGTLTGAVASVYHVISHVSATNSATIALAEKTVNTLQGWLGQPVTDFAAANG